VTCCATIEGLRIEPLQPSAVPVPHVTEATLQTTDRSADPLSNRPADLARVARRTPWLDCKRSPAASQQGRVVNR
jgi:hypothetical protein